MGDNELFLGRDADSGERVLLDPDHLTTHAVCLGMTGSGKTGLGIVALEELARRGVPLLVVDLKGDMVDLLLSFPGLSAAEFAPWVPPDAVRDRGREAAADDIARRWREGLAGWGLGPDDSRAVREGLAWGVLTPGAAAAPLDILPALAAPAGWDPDAAPDAAADRVNSVAGALLSLVGRGGDPLTDRDQVLVAALLLELWRRGEAPDLPRLLQAIADPPFPSIGALPVDTFYPRSDRMELVLALNTLLASPAFAAWTRGTPLTMEALLGEPGRPRGSVVTVAHLDDRGRQFALALLLGELLAWTRRQPASESLRALLYIDEVQGILPPHPANPPTKAPLLTLLKQARAFGVGVWLATQNPVDLDYKALGNAGIKLVGRLVTERDRARALEGLDLEALPDGRKGDQVVTALAGRQFLLDDVRARPRTRVMGTRWALSYLRGPVTLAELGPLVKGVDAPPAATAAPAAAPSASGPPVLAAAFPVRFAAPPAASAWPWLLVRSSVTLERRSIDLLRTSEESWRVPVDEAGRLRWEHGELLDGDVDLMEVPPAGMGFPAAVPPALEPELRGAKQGFVSWRTLQPATLLSNPALKLVAESGESRSAFVERCMDAADRADDTVQERIRARFERRIDTVRRRLGRERDELERDRAQLNARQAEEKLGMVEGLFSVLLGSRSLRSAAGKAASRARSVASKRRMTQRAAGSVTESEQEISRLEDELEDLASELEGEVERVAAASEATAAAVEELLVRPSRSGVRVLEMALVWGSRLTE